MQRLVATSSTRGEGPRCENVGYSIMISVVDNAVADAVDARRLKRDALDDAQSGRGLETI